MQKNWAKATGSMMLSLIKIIFTLAEPIFERNKERGASIFVICEQRVTQLQPKSDQPLRGGSYLAVCCVAPHSQTSRVCSFVAPCIQSKSEPPKEDIILVRLSSGNNEDIAW